MTEVTSEIIQGILPDIIRVRRHLHQHPELSFKEQATSQFIRTWLASRGIEFLEAPGDLHGTVALIRGQSEKPMVALRADIDALPIVEKKAAPYKSVNPGIMHACGHDGHTAILLGTAAVLSQTAGRLPGSILCIFQPGEENGGGGEKLLQTGMLDRFPIQAIFALHAWPYLPVGTIGIRYGAMMAGIDDFKIIVHGRSGHAAHPLNAIDPVYISAQIINAVQSLITREKHAADPAVISVTSIHGGTANNVIPGEVEMLGTIRTLQHGTRERLRQRFAELTAGTAAAFGGRATVAIENSYPPVINDDEMTMLVAATGREVLGRDKVVELTEPSMGGEDFGYYLKVYPGTIFRLGVGSNHALHSDHFDFSDEALSPGMQMMSNLAIRALGYWGNAGG